MLCVYEEALAISEESASLILLAELPPIVETIGPDRNALVS
jgi:hypothetical protein